MSIIDKKIKDKKVILLIKKILSNYEAKETSKGMPLGNWTSQFFANIYLNELDYFVKHQLKAKYYFRYVDDFIILHRNRDFLEGCSERISLFLKERLKLELHQEKSKILQKTSWLKASCFSTKFVVLKKILFQSHKNRRRFFMFQKPQFLQLAGDIRAMHIR